MSGIGWKGLGPLLGVLLLSSFVKTETNCSFKMFALPSLSLFMNPSLFFRSGMPISSCPKLFTEVQTLSSTLL